jgi:hypothetical protein
MKNKIIIFLLLFLAFNLCSKNSRKEIVQKLFRSIENWFGTQYVYGGKSKKGTDCSGFVAQVYKEVFDINLPRSVREQRKLGKLVTNNLQPGDLLFFKINDTVSHVGIYVFDNKFIHAASQGPSIGVTKSSLKEKYYKTRYAFAKRIITLPPYEKENNKKENSIKKIQKNTPIKEKNIIILGKVLFKGKLLEISDNFVSKNPIFLQIENDNKILNKYKVILLNEKTNNITYELNINNSNKQDIKKIFLDKGIYKVKAFNNINNKLLNEKKIVVN